MAPELGVLGEMAHRTTILRADIGSRGYGLNTVTSDHDHKAVCIEDFEVACAFGLQWEQWGPEKWKVDEYTLYPEGLDLEIYSLKKFLQLAMKGNPTVISMLFNSEPVYLTDVGRELRTLTPKILSKRVGSAFSGYMKEQENRLKTRGRAALIERYGYDVKFAMHLIRVGLQGTELLSTGEMSVPFPDGSVRDHLMEIREGKVSVDHVLEEAKDIHAQIDALKEKCDFPDEPDSTSLMNWMQHAYWDEWEGQMALDRLLRETYSDSIH